MKIPVACPGCDRRYEVDDRFAGKTLKCAHCEKPMTIPAADPPTQAAVPTSSEYELGAAAHQIEPSTFRRASARRENDTTQDRKRARPRKKTGKTAKRKKRGREPVVNADTLPTILISLAAITIVLALLGYFVPSVRKWAGMSLALPGLLLCLYGYATAVYIAFTEDDFYGWLFLIFPFYAAYYVVSRWDEMRSRLIMVGVGLALLTVGAKFLEADRAREQMAMPEAAAKA
jgi:hypothetical protein